MEFDKTCRCPKCVELKLPRDGAAFWCVIFFSCFVLLISICFMQYTYKKKKCFMQYVIGMVFFFFFCVCVCV
jgi:hypothetical protein